MHVEIIREESQFQALERIWNPLLETSPTGVVFLTFEWLSTWWRHFREGKRLFVVLVRHADGIVGAAPLVLAMREGFRVLTMLGSSSADYADFLVDANQDRARVVTEIMRAVAGDRSWDFFLLSGLRGDSPTFHLLASELGSLQLHRPRISELHRSPYVPIDQPWESYWSSLRKDFRKDSERQVRRLGEQRGAISYARPETPADVDACMDEFIEQHRSRWKDADDVFKNPAATAFYKDLARLLRARDWLNLQVLAVNGTAAAIVLAFDYAGRCYVYSPVFAEPFSKYSAGRLLLLHVFEDAFRRGLREVDLLAGDEPYKFEFRPAVRRLYSVSLCQAGLRGRVADMWFRQLRPGMEEAVRANGVLRRINGWLLKAGIRR